MDCCASIQLSRCHKYTRIQGDIDGGAVRMMLGTNAHAVYCREMCSYILLLPRAWQSLGQDKARLVIGLVC